MRISNEPVAVEHISDVFTKYHLGEWVPNKPVLHQFSAPDQYYPHDHPWGFTSFVISGCYVEEIFHIRPDGTWTNEFVTRWPGQSHTVPATHVHRIVDLPQGECWTLVLAGEPERETHFWRFHNPIAQKRAWFEENWSDAT